MTYPVGSIILARDYQLPTKVKDKFLIVIFEDKGEYNLLSVTTSQVYFDVAKIKHGIITDRDMSLYCFEQKRVIGKNGFSFSKHTFISHRYNVHCLTEDQLQKLNIEIKDELTQQEIKDLIYSFYKYKGTSKRYKLLLERVLMDMHK